MFNDDYKQLKLEQGTIEYARLGRGPTLVFIHDILTNANIWFETVRHLKANYDCVGLNIPFGSHRLAMPAGVDISPAGLALVVAQSLERLNLHNVILVGNDSGGAIAQLLIIQSGLAGLF